MRYNDEIEKAIVAQIKAHPNAPLILPDWAYWNGKGPWIYRDSLPVRLVEHLYEVLVGEVPRGWRVSNPPGVGQKNVNPFVATLARGRGSRTHCQNGHEYTERDWLPDKRRHRCHICYEEQLKKARKVGGRLPIAELNRRKTHCPKGHQYTRENTSRKENGSRQCKICRAEQARAARARKKEQNR